MATEVGELTEDPFLKKTGVIRQDLEKRFREYQLSLQQRKDQLIAKLDTAEKEYTAGRAEYKQKLQAIEQIQTSIKQQTVSFKSMESSLLAETDRQILQIKGDYPDRHIELSIDSAFKEKIETLGTIEVTTLSESEQEYASVESYEELDERTETETTKIVSEKPQITPDTEHRDETKPLTTRDYSKITHPIVSAVEQGDRPCDLRYPQKVAVDSKTGNIFIADQTSHAVKIYNQKGEFVSEVQYCDNFKNVQLVHPYGVCFYRDSLYVTSLMEMKPALYSEAQPCVFRFVRDPVSAIKFLYSVSTGIHGSYESLFKRPSAISADQENGDVYVCDEECRVKVLDKYLSYKRLLRFDHDKIVDLQITKERLYLLSLKVLYVLTKQYGAQINSFFFSQHYSQIYSTSIYIDTKPFFIVSGASGSSYISILEQDTTQRSNNSTRHLSSFKIEDTPADDGCFEIRGITADTSTQKLIVVSHSKNNMLQIY